MNEKKNVTLIMVAVDGEGVAVTWDLRMTEGAAKKVQDFCATLSNEEVEE